MPESSTPATPAGETAKAAASPTPVVDATPAGEAGKTIAVTKTSIAPASSGPQSSPRAAPDPQARPVEVKGIIVDTGPSRADGFVWDARVFDRETPDYLIPKMDQLAVSTPTYFRQLLIHDPRADVTGRMVQIQTSPTSAERRPWGDAITSPIDAFVELDAIPLPGEPIFGALVSFEQGWFEKGLALGRLLHSTCLAPGEVTKIAVTSFHRQSLGRNDEDATQQDRLESATDNASAVAETQAAVSHELKTGNTSNFSMANQTQAGMAGGGLLFSGNASTATNLAMGLTTAVASAATDFKAEGAKQVSQNTVAASQAVRARRASQVRETNEDESQTGQTRVIANYNHMHALTMMFFEVLQCFTLETRVIDAERVIYIPMRDMEFTPDRVRDFSEVLRTIFIEQDLPDMVEMLDSFLIKDIAALQQEEANARKALEDFLRQVPGELNEHPERGYPRYAAADQMISAAMRAHSNDIGAAAARIAALDPGAGNAMHNSQVAFDWLNSNLSKLPNFRIAHAKLMDAVRIIPLLNAHRLAFNQHMWMRMDASRVQRLVYQKVVEADGKRLALDRLMDPKPIGVFGNFVAFRLPQLTNAESVEFAKNYVTEPGRANGVTASIVLPSGGLFGEAVLGQAISAEKIDLTRFWNWQDSPIPILPPELSPLGMGSRARDIAFSPVTMEASIVELIKQVEPTFTSPAELAKSVVAKISESMVAGQAALQAAQVGQVGAGAIAVGDQNVRLQKQAQDFAVAALNSKAAQAAIGMIAPEAQTATMMGGLLGANKPSGGKAGDEAISGLGIVAKIAGKGIIPAPPAGD